MASLQTTATAHQHGVGITAIIQATLGSFKLTGFDVHRMMSTCYEVGVNMVYNKLMQATFFSRPTPIGGP